MRQHRVPGSELLGTGAAVVLEAIVVVAVGKRVYDTECVVVVAVAR